MSQEPKIKLKSISQFCLTCFATVCAILPALDWCDCMRKRSAILKACD